MNVTNHGPTHQNPVVTTRARRQVDMIIPNHMPIQPAGQMLKVAVGGEEASFRQVEFGE